MLYNSRLQRKTPLKRSTKPLKRSPIKRSAKPIKQYAPGEKQVKEELSRLKAEIELEALQDGTYYCKGCGGARCNNSGLDKCHILPIGRYKQLELVKENLELMGRPCHEIWDSGTLEEKKELLNYDHMMSIVLKYDELWYNRLCDNNAI